MNFVNCLSSHLLHVYLWNLPDCSWSIVQHSQSFVASVLMHWQHQIQNRHILIFKNQ